MNTSFTFPIRVYVEDTDVGGVVYHPNYLKFMERARTEWAMSQGISFPELLKQGIFFVIRAAKLEYLKPARLQDNLIVITRIAKLGRASIIYEQTIQDAKNPEHIHCTGEIVSVCVNLHGKPHVLPEQILEVYQHE